MLSLKQQTKIIKEEAISLGFSACGITPAVYLEEEKKRLEFWLTNQYHADMHYMENHFEKRINPSMLYENAKSVVVVLLNYYPSKLQKNNRPVVAKYAYGKDYHSIIKKRLKKLLAAINHKIGPTQGRYFTDSAPLLERALARKAGLGWIGKNAMLIHKKLGSFIFIGELIVDRELEYDDSMVKDYCGNCNLCIKACPNRAIVSPRIIDARRCISYLTIENKSKIENTFNLSNCLFGCDICQDICPWNRKAVATSDPELLPIKKIIEMDYIKWTNLTEEEFHLCFAQSPLKRAGFKGIKRNIEFLDKKSSL